MNINFDVSVHHQYDGFQLKADFDNGYSVSIIPYPQDPTQAELGLFFMGDFVSSIELYGETMFQGGVEVLPLEECLDICYCIRDIVFIDSIEDTEVYA